MTPGRVVLGDGVFLQLADRDGLLRVGAVVYGEGGFHSGHVALILEVQLGDLLQAPCGTFLNTHETTLAVLRPDRVSPVLPRTSHNAHIGAHDVAVVAPVAHAATHAAIRLRSGLLLRVGEGHLDLLIPDALFGRSQRCLDSRRVLEVRGVEPLVGHYLDRRIRGQLEGRQDLVNVARRPLAVSEGVDHHRRPANDVSAGEDVVLETSVGVRLEETSLDEVVGNPVQVLDLTDGDHHVVAFDLVLGPLGHLGRYVALFVLRQMRFAEHGGGDHTVVSENPRAGGSSS